MRQVILNILGIVAEIIMIVSISCSLLVYPWWMAVVTTILIIFFCCILECSRQKHEDSFYFVDESRFRLFLLSLTGVTEGSARALAAGIAVLFTFSGNDKERTFVLACIFAFCLFLGTGLLRRGFYKYGMRPLRWSYFRLSFPLGLMFSSCVHIATELDFLAVASLKNLAGYFFLDLSPRPTIQQMSDLAFKIRHTIDALIADVSGNLLGQIYAPFVAILVSINILIGFVLAAYVAIILEVVLFFEGGRR